MAIFSPTVEFLLRAARRSAALYLYYSGRIRTFQARSMGRGALPWRILRYERVVNPEELPFPISPASFVRPRTFETHLRYLRTECTVMPLGALLINLENGEELPPNAVALTFDCGYAEVYQHAFPLLLKYQLPATIFLPTAFIGTLGMFWEEKTIAALTAMAAAGKPLPRLSFFGDEIHRALDMAAPNNRITPEAAFLLVDLVPTFSNEDRELFLAYLGEELNQIGEVSTRRTFLDWPEVIQMQSAGISFGTMGHAHQLFTGLTAEGMAADLHQSLITFRENSVQPLPILSFPYGMTDARVNQALFTIGVRNVMGIGLEAMDFSVPDFRVFGRLPLFQDPVFCRELFACALWDIEAFGFKF